MVENEEALKRQLAYFVKCVDAVETPAEIPPHPHSGYVHVSLIPTGGHDLESVNRLMQVAMDEGKLDSKDKVPGCKLCVDRMLYEVIRKSPTFPSGSFVTAQALIFRTAIYQCATAVHLPALAERTVNQRMANIRKHGRGSPKSVSWPSGEFMRFIAGNEEYIFGSKFKDDEGGEGGYHYFGVSVGGFDFQCCFEHIGKSRGLGPAMSEMTRLAMLCAAWQRHSGGFSINTPRLHPRRVVLGPKLTEKLGKEIEVRRAAKEPLLDVETMMVPVEGMGIYFEGHENEHAGYTVRSATNQVFSSGHTELVAHLTAWMDKQRMSDEMKLGWPRLLEAQKSKSGSYYFEDESD